MNINKDRDEKDLKMQIKKIKLEEYLPMNNSTDFKLPDIKAYCFRSKLYHEKMVENIVSTTLNKLAYKNNDAEEKLKVNSDKKQDNNLIDNIVKRTNCI